MSLILSHPHVHEVTWVYYRCNNYVARKVSFGVFD